MSLSNIAVPCVICFVIVFGIARRCDMYSSFVLGAGDGLKTAISIIPQLVGLFVAIKAFGASGAMDFVVSLLTPLARLVHFPPEALPFALMRPVSGSGSLALATELFKQYGTDSFVGRVISVMMGSTETTFYTIAVYFGAAGVKNIRHSLFCALAADLLSAFLSVAVCSVFFL